MEHSGKIIPRIIIHGGAGNITRTSLPKDRYDEYQASLNRILAKAYDQLHQIGATALDIATYAVSLLEDDPLYNSGRGAVFTREGQNELECSIMVSNGYRKRGIGCMMLKHVKNPIKLARELLIRGEHPGGDGSQEHCEFSGEFVERLAKDWGLEIVDPSYFFTQKRWDEHLRGLEVGKEREKQRLPLNELSDWEKENHISMGTCGAVVLDSFGTICCATSTGGLTNKVPGRVGDTPLMGAGYWAEEWTVAESLSRAPRMIYKPSATTPMDKLSRGDFGTLLGDCLPINSPSTSAEKPSQITTFEKSTSTRHAIGFSGTGNGDSFVRLCSARTAAAYSRFTNATGSEATSWMAGPGGELQKSAGDRWKRAPDGVGGMIGIEIVGNKGNVVWDFNSPGMFRAWSEEDGTMRSMIFRKSSWESGPKDWNSPWL